MKKRFEEQIKLRGELLTQFGAGYYFEREKKEVQKDDKVQLLIKLRKKIGNCQLCELHLKRTNIVFGEGNSQAKIMFVGEAPGEEEDIQGIPFVGRAGQLLTDIITKGMRINREDVYIANIVKCRPPENRTPRPMEALTCLPFLKGQISIISPQVIVCLGKVAVSYLLQRAEPIGQLRGKWFDYNGIPVMATFHPSYLLRNPSAKADVWQDIQEVMKKVGLPIPKKK
ncbi:MAG: uracil-DNA glycosylase [Acidobacteria bacterium]|nr:uracil-DNA glycosylase [Acidobacteriota bacterium]